MLINMYGDAQSGHLGKLIGVQVRPRPPYIVHPVRGSKGPLSVFELAAPLIGGSPHSSPSLVCRISASDNGTPSARFMALVVTLSLAASPP